MTTQLPAADVISTAKLRQLMVNDPQIRILDVRTGGEFESAHIPGSYNVPLDTLGEHVADLADVSHPVVLVCQSGGRATQAHQRLTTAGKDTLHILEGGMNAWMAGGGDIVQLNTDRWALERQVRFVAGSIVLVAILVSLLWDPARYLAGAVGFGLFFSAATNTCAMGNLLARLPYNRTDRCDIAGVLADLNRANA